MPDTSAAIITIGGRVTSIEALESLLEAFTEEGGPDWPDGFDSPAEALEHIQTAAANNRPVSLFNTAASRASSRKPRRFAKNTD